MSDIITRRVGDTTVRIGDLALIGQAVLNLAAASVLMRHATPDGTTEYAEPEGMAQQVACDFAAWSARQDEAGRRLVAFLRECGWLDRVAELTEKATS
jgi:hypothetical protein